MFPVFFRFSFCPWLKKANFPVTPRVPHCACVITHIKTSCRLDGCPVLWTAHLAQFYRRRPTGPGMSAFLRTFGGQRFSAKPFTHMARLHSCMNGWRRRCHSWPYLDILTDSCTTQMQVAGLGMMRTAYKYGWYNLNDRYIGLMCLRQMSRGCKVDGPASQQSPVTGCYVGGDEFSSSIRARDCFTWFLSNHLTPQNKISGSQRN